MKPYIELLAVIVITVAIALITAVVYALVQCIFYPENRNIICATIHGLCKRSRDNC